MLLLIIAAALSGGGGNQSQQNSSGTGTGDSSAAAASTLEEWLAAVYKSGTFFNGKTLPRSTSGAFCQSPAGPAILIGEYTSKFEAQNDLANLKGRPYAYKTSGDYLEIFLSNVPGSAAEAALSPLAKFGFQFGTA